MVFWKRGSTVATRGGELKFLRSSALSQTQTTPVPQLICDTIHGLNDLAMQEWTDAFITNAQHELVGMIKDWKYDYGADDKACSAMLLWMVLKLNPKADIDATLLQPFDHS